MRELQTRKFGSPLNNGRRYKFNEWGNFNMS